MLVSLGLAALRSLLLVALVQACLQLVRLRRPQLLLTCWTAVLAASLAMPLLQRIMAWKLAIPVPESQSTTLAVSAVAASPPVERTLAAAHLYQPKPDWPRILIIVYAVIAGILLFRLVVGLGLSAAIWYRARRLSLEGVRGVTVRISPAVNGPFTLGNTVLLPEACTGWPEDKLRAVVAHEKAHATAGDYYVLLMSQLSRAIFWFSPISWWLHDRVTMLAEMASDDAAIAASGDRVRYAQVLLDFAAQNNRAVMGVAMARPNTVERRIERILAGSDTPPRAGLVERMLVVTGVLCVTVIVTASVAHRVRPDTPQTVAQPLSYKPIKLDTGQLERYAGYYRNSQNGSVMVVTRAGDHLDTHRAGFPPVPEYPYTDTDFFLTTVPQQNTFVVDPSGTVMGIVHHQDGRDERLDRVDDTTGRQIAGAVEQRFAEERSPHVEQPIDPSLLDAYSGSYLLPPATNVAISREEGKLLVQVEGRPAHEFHAYGKLDFFSTSAAAQISFTIGGNGTAVGFVLHAGGKDRVARRLDTKPAETTANETADAPW